MTLISTKKNATVQDVARHAKVSTATVSRTLSAPDTVSAKKREAVLAAIAATGYSVNRAARSLRTQRTNTVLALLPTLGNPFFSVVLHGMVEELTRAGQSLVIAETAQLYTSGEDLLTYFLAQRADGMIVLDGGLPEASFARLKSSEYKDQVVFACEWSHHASFPSVRSDNYDGARLAVNHLLQTGHTDILHVTGPADNVLTQVRIDGYTDACAAGGLTPRFIAGDFSIEAGLRAADEIMKMSQPPSAVFCASDEIAFGLISGLTRAGMNVPRDLSVVGFDDIEYSEHLVPPLTTIRQDRAGLGRMAASLLLNPQADASEAVTTIPVELIERESTA